MTNTQLEQVLEISAVRKQIFKGAVAPATVLSFLCKKSSLNHKVEYISLKPNKWGKNRNELQVALNQCVMRMYGLQDNYFVDYALSIQIPLLCGTYQETKCDAKSMKEYVSILSKIWDEHFGQSNVHYKITIYPDIKGKFAAVQVKLSFTSQIEDIFVIDNVDEDVSLLTNFMIYQLNDFFYQTKNVVEFSEDSFVIVKPIEAKNWHPAMAIKDSYKVLNAVLLGKEDCR